MELEIRKYEALEISINPPLPIQDLKRWQEGIAVLIKQISQESSLAIFTPRPNSNSLGYDIGEIERKGTMNAIKYLVTALKKPSVDEIIEITTTDEFYLGLIALLIGDVNESIIQALLLTWDKEPVRSGAEFLKMDSDGLCLCWYNPKPTEKAHSYFNALCSSWALRMAT